MRSGPTVVAFDVIETVFSLEKLRGRLTAIGLPGETLEVWFARILRDAFALEATEVYHPFRDIASATLTSLIAEHGSPPDSNKVSNVIDGFGELDAHLDARDAFSRLSDAKIRIITLTNGSEAVTDKLLRRAGLDRFVERLISVEEIRHWKPRRDVYLHAAKRAEVEPQQLALVATHAWDIHGAGCAGLTTAFVARGQPYPNVMKPPHITAANLAEAAEALVRLRASSN